MPDPILVVVPARGGSVGVPRKNRRLVDGVPLAVRAALAAVEGGAIAGVPVRVVVSTDDPVIAEQARAEHLKVVARPDHLTGPDVTVADVVVATAWDLRHDGPVAAVQPTAVTLPGEVIGDTFARFVDGGHAVASTVVAEHGQRWLCEDGADPVLVGAFVNRQFDRPTLWRETGGLRIARSALHLEAHGWVDPAGDHLMVELDPEHAVDVDTPADFAAARAQAERLTVLFVVTAGEQVGSGHVRRALTIADELGHHHLEWAWAGDEVPGWAYSEVEASGLFDGTTTWPCRVPDGAVVVFDKLDTTVADHAAVADAGGAAVCLEDLGAGLSLAAFTVNELYPVGSFTGPGWAVLRPEFAGRLHPPPGQRRVLVMFGVTDPAGMNVRAANVAALTVRAQVTVLASGRPRPDGLAAGVRWLSDGMAATEMRAADVVVTSCGRTVNEASALGRTVVAVAANHRELDHVHAPCVTYLGLHAAVTDDTLAAAVFAALDHPEWGHQAAEAVSHTGAQRVARLIELAGHP